MICYVKEGKNAFFDLDGKASSNPLASVINYLGQFYLKDCLTQILQ